MWRLSCPTNSGWISLPHRIWPIVWRRGWLFLLLVQSWQLFLLITLWSIPSTCTTITNVFGPCPTNIRLSLPILPMKSQNVWYTWSSWSSKCFPWFIEIWEKHVNSRPFKVFLWLVFLDVKGNMTDMAQIHSLWLLWNFLKKKQNNLSTNRHCLRDSETQNASIKAISMVHLASWHVQSLRYGKPYFKNKIFPGFF